MEESPKEIDLLKTADFTAPPSGFQCSKSRTGLEKFAFLIRTPGEAQAHKSQTLHWKQLLV